MIEALIAIYLTYKTYHVWRDKTKTYIWRIWTNARRDDFDERGKFFRRKVAHRMRVNVEKIFLYPGNR